jgi:hypothetical protein
VIESERIAPLTTLAKQLWPDATELEVGVETMCPDADDDVAYVDVAERTAWKRMVLIEHPRCLEALEAALPALAQEAPTLDAKHAQLVEVADKLAACRARAEKAEAKVEAALVWWRENPDDHGEQRYIDLWEILR